MRRFEFSILFVVCFQLLINAENYKIVAIPLEATSSATISNKVIQAGDARVQGTITYYDGFGYPTQEMLINTTPSHHNTMSMIQYQGIGIPIRTWLPVPSSTNSEMPISTISTIADTFYTDTYAYQTTTYEKGGLHRPIAQTASGSVWQQHASTIEYGSNEANEVIKFSVSISNELFLQGYYEAHQLQKTTLTDEDGLVKVEYKDLQGRTIMTKIGQNACTYYVYDGLNHLRIVLSPMAVQLIGTNINHYTAENDIIKKYAYVYQYNSHGDCTYKRLPGCEPVRMFYDKADRLILSQDGEQSNYGDGRWWTLYMYDQYNRIVYTGFTNTHCDYNDLKELSSESFQVASLTNTEYGYVNNYFPDMRMLHVYYYDDYQYLSLLPSSVQSHLQYDDEQEEVTRETSSIGRLTGERIYNLNEDGYITIAYYYDHHGNVIQCRATNHLGGYNLTYTQYSFSNQPEQINTVLTGVNTDTITELYTFTYDHADRLITTRYKYGNEDVITLSTNTYDDLGRVTSRYIHNGQGNIAYSYNIHNQPTSIQSTIAGTNSSFAENIFYNTQCPSGATPYYNGNVSATTWNYAGQTNGYEYSYDAQNRLSGTYSIINNQRADYAYAEYFNFDKNGNITGLVRFDNSTSSIGDLVPIDDLQMTYNGNQLINIVDNAGSQNSNSIKEYQDYSWDSSNNEMEYDNNGALVRDLDRNILSIQNNILSLPSEITFDNGNKIFHYYDATGQRYRTESVTYQWTGVTRPAGTGNTGTSQSTLTTINDITHINDNLVFKQLNAGPITLSRATNPEGYVAPTFSEGADGIDASVRHGMSFCYYIKDHLGNIREVYQSCKETLVDLTELDENNQPMVVDQYYTPLTCIQRMQYYPSGLPWKDCYRADEQTIKYNGKEFVEMHGIDEYDSQARWYYPAIMRTTTMDPLCEKYYSTSPYAWCGNNPINYVDPDGKQVTVSVSNVALGNTTIKLFSGQECKNNPLLNSKTVTVPFYEVVVTNESGSKCTAYFTRIGYRGNANDPNQDPEEVTFDVREPGDKFRAVIKDRWNKQNNVLELRDLSDIKQQSIKGRKGKVDANRKAIQFHVLGATDGCLMAVGTNTIDATVNLPDMPNTSTEMQEQFMQAIINMQLEDEQNNKNSDIYVTFEQLY